MEKNDLERKRLNPQKLNPPAEVIKELVEKEKKRLPANPVLRFCKIFFGEGY